MLRGEEGSIREKKERVTPPSQAWAFLAWGGGKLEEGETDDFRIYCDVCWECRVIWLISRAFVLKLSVASRLPPPGKVGVGSG